MQVQDLICTWANIIKSLALKLNRRNKIKWAILITKLAQSLFNKDLYQRPEKVRNLINQRRRFSIRLNPIRIWNGKGKVGIAWLTLREL